MQELGSHTSRFHSLHSLVSSLENLGEPRVRVCVCVCAEVGEPWDWLGWGWWQLWGLPGGRIQLAEAESFQGSEQAGTE